MGQLRNWRDWRVERDLRAVKERATSSEQLARRRERRWRKGLEESQMVVFGGRMEGFLQGSLEVGMLRDWRALSCFGSSVLEDGEDGKVGDLGVVVEFGGVGEEVGDGVGGSGALADGEDGKVGDLGVVVEFGGVGEELGDGVGGSGALAERAVAERRRRR
ncbi:hypothetical protein ACFXTI_036517 [Malus domestica]